MRNTNEMIGHVITIVLAQEPEHWHMELPPAVNGMNVQIIYARGGGYDLECTTTACCTLHMTPLSQLFYSSAPLSCFLFDNEARETPNKSLSEAA